MTAQPGPSNRISFSVRKAKSEGHYTGTRFSRREVVATMPGAPEATLSLYTYRAASDPHPFETFDECMCGSFDTLAVIEPHAARGEGRADFSRSEMGYAARPASVHVLTGAQVPAHFANDRDVVRAMLIHHAIKLVASPTDLVLTEFSGASHDKDGKSTLRTCAEALGFWTGGPSVQGLPKERLGRLISAPWTMPPITRRPPKIPLRDLVAPEFPGMLFARTIPDAPEYDIDDRGRLRSEQEIVDPGLLRELILGGIKESDLVLIGADARTTVDAGRVPRLALQGADFQVPLRATERTLSKRSHPWKIRVPIAAEFLDWLAWLVDNADMPSALDAFERVYFSQYGNPYERAQHRTLKDLQEHRLTADTKRGFGVGTERRYDGEGERVHAVIVDRGRDKRPLLVPMTGQSRAFYPSRS